MESPVEMKPCDSCKSIDASGLWKDEYIDGYQSDRDVPSDPETEKNEVEASDDISELADESKIIKKVWGSSSEDSTEETEDGDEDNADKPKKRVRRFFIEMPSGTKRNIYAPVAKNYRQIYRDNWSCSNQETKRIRLRTYKREYKMVKDEMHSTIVWHNGYDFKNYNIIKIEKLVNGCKWKEYLHRQREIKGEIGYTNQRMLWHGSTAVDDIVKNGFNEQYSNANGMFGAGIYFAKHSSKSNQYTFGSGKAKGCTPHNDKNCKICVRKMLLCRVTLGKTKIVYTFAQYPHPPKGFHSVTAVPKAGVAKNLKYPEYIVYRREQVYPEYYIEYKLA